MIILRQLPLNLPLQSDYAYANFIQAECNQEALQLVEAWPNWTNKMSAIYGERGCGKTHLGHIWQQKARARFITPSDIENFTPVEVAQTSHAFVLDNADTIVQNGEKNAEWLFHFYNLIKREETYLLICCFQPPARWTLGLPDLHSRLSTIASVSVRSPDQLALRTILYKLCSEHGMILSTEIADYILSRIQRSFESARVLIETLNRYTLSTRRSLTLGLVKEILTQPEIHQSSE